MNSRFNTFMFGYLFVIFFALIVSCAKEYDDQIEEVKGDVFIKASIRDSAVVYGVAYFAYANKPMKTVQASLYESSVGVFLDSTDYGYTFLNNPSLYTQKTGMPTAGEYEFMITFQDGTQAQVFDELSSEIISPARIDSVVTNSNKQQLTVYWNKVSGADGYRLQLKKGDAEIVYETDLLDKNITKFELSSDHFGWRTNVQPEMNNTFRLILNAYKFEPYATVHDLQCIAVNDTMQLLWLF